jgi:hypothetical protein
LACAISLENIERKVLYLLWFTHGLSVPPENHVLEFNPHCEVLRGSHYRAEKWGLWEVIQLDKVIKDRIRIDRERPQYIMHSLSLAM